MTFLTLRAELDYVTGAIDRLTAAVGALSAQRAKDTAAILAAIAEISAGQAAQNSTLAKILAELSGPEIVNLNPQNAIITEGT